MDEEDDSIIQPFMESISSNNRVKIGFSKPIRPPADMSFSLVALKKQREERRELKEITFLSKKSPKFHEIYDVHKPLEVDLISSEDDSLAALSVPWIFDSFNEVDMEINLRLESLSEIIDISMYDTIRL